MFKVVHQNYLPNSSHPQEQEFEHITDAALAAYSIQRLSIMEIVQLKDVEHNVSIKYSLLEHENWHIVDEGVGCNALLTAVRDAKDSFLVQR